MFLVTIVHIVNKRLNLSFFLARPALLLKYRSFWHMKKWYCKLSYYKSTTFNYGITKTTVPDSGSCNSLLAEAQFTIFSQQRDLRVVCIALCLRFT